MQLGSYRRIYDHDYAPEMQDMIKTLSVTVNDSFDSVYSALANNLTFADNFLSTIANFTVTLNSKNVPLVPTTIKLNNFQKNVNGMFVINAIATAQGITPTGAIYIGYTVNNSIPNAQNTATKSNPITITVNYVLGLPQNQEFTLTAIII